MKNATANPANNGMFVIACNKRDAPGVTLFMLDRNKVRYGQNFWTEVLDDSVLRVRVRTIADGIVAKLRYQNPRVMTSAEAQLAADTNDSLRGRDDDDIDPEGGGWDAHKD